MITGTHIERGGPTKGAHIPFTHNSGAPFFSFFFFFSEFLLTFICIHPILTVKKREFQIFMFESISSLSFRCAFDILWFDEVDIFEQRNAKSTISLFLRAIDTCRTIPFRYAFEILFGYRVMQRLACTEPHPFPNLLLVQQTNPWMEILVACHIVQNLDHPAHALFLLHPMENLIPESRKAWAFVQRFSGLERTVPVVPWVLIRAMKAFIPVPHDHEEDVFPFLDLPTLRQERVLSEWMHLSAQTIAHCHFMRRWWTERSDVCRLDGWQEYRHGVWSFSMENVIYTKSDEEREVLLAALIRTEIRKSLNSIVKKKRRVDESKTKKKEPLPRKLNLNEIHLAKTQAKHEYKTHVDLLKEVKAMLKMAPVGLFDTKLDVIAGHVMHLAASHPKIKWSLKRLLHEIVADRAGLFPFFIERQICRPRKVSDENPLSALRRICSP